MTKRIETLLERLVEQNDEIIALLEQRGSVVKLLEGQDEETKLAFAYGLLSPGQRIAAGRFQHPQEKNKAA